MMIPRLPLPTLIERRVARTPHRPAVAAGAAHLTYAQLNARANRLAHHLISRRVGPEDLIAVALPRSLDMMVALLAVLKSGAAYVPIDPKYPAERVRHVLDDARPSLLLTTVGREPSPAGTILLDDAATMDVMARFPDTDPTDAERVAPLSMANAAYVIYTSGSTGAPKGVVVEHTALTDYLLWTTAAYPGAAGVALVPTSLAFDLSVTGLYTPLLAGGCVHLISVPAYHAADVQRLRRSPCTFLKVTPSHLAVLAKLPEEFAPTGELLLGGEALSGSAVQHWRDQHGEVTVFNVYGPTETTVNCAEYRIEPGAALGPGPVPIGRPQAGNSLYLLDAALRPVPPGITGELYVGGTGVARGYLGQPDLTAERFVPDPFGGPGARMYRTGDLAHRLDDGDLVFVGRSDDQVKLRGFRVEPAEVEMALAGAEIAEVACAVRETYPENRQLVAYVVPRPGHRIDPAKLRRDAGARLPSHLVPASVVILDRLPRTPNGKLDRAALPTPTLAPGDGPAPGDPHSGAGLDVLGPMLPLRLSGNGPPLFCVHPTEGLSWAYRDLVGAMPADRPVYGLQAPWLAEGRPRPGGLAEVVTDYLERIRQIQPHGPYHLFGASFGGLVAHALATRLQASGERVASLSLAEAYPHHAMPDGSPTVPPRGLEAVLRLLGTRRPRSAEPPDDQATRMRQVLALAQVCRDCEWLASHFTPARFDGDLLVFIARPAVAVPASWREYVSGTVTAHVVDSPADDLMQPDPLAAVGAVLAARMALTDRR